MKASKFMDPQKSFVIKQGEEGTPVAEICRKAGISQATYFHWKKKYAGLMPSEMRRLRELEDENSRLKKIVADLTLDREMLQDVTCSSGMRPPFGRVRRQGVGRYEAQPFHRGADLRAPARAGGGDGDGGGVPPPRDQLGDLLQVEVEVRRSGCVRSPAAAIPRRGQRPAEEASGRGDARQYGTEGPDVKKMVTPGAKREAVAYAREQFGLSERRACQLVGIARRVARLMHPRARTLRSCGPGCASWPVSGAGSATGAWAICWSARGSRPTTRSCSGSTGRKG